MQYSAETFHSLLKWLDSDDQHAAEKYEAIRQRLVQLFTVRGCLEPEELADETMTRVAQRIPEIATSYHGEPSVYFYGVARRVLRDHLRQHSRQGLAERDLLVSDAEKGESREQLYDCLDKCMLTLTEDKRELLIAYYQNSKQAKIVAHRELAAQLGVSSGILRARLHRIRMALRQCVESCMKSHRRRD